LKIQVNRNYSFISHTNSFLKKNLSFSLFKNLAEEVNQSKEIVQAKVLLHNEYLLLQILKHVKNPFHIDRCYEFLVENIVSEKTKMPAKRITLVLDAYSDKDSANWYNINQENHWITLQDYISRQKLNEREALPIFYEIVKVVEQIHLLNICHRDIKIGNFLINYQTRHVKLTNFCLGKLLSSDNQRLYDQRGSPAYISPDILQGSYLGKASDVWSLGVILYILIFSQFPFIENTTAALFKKICQCELTFPTESGRVSEDTKQLIKNHLLTTTDRFTATETRVYLERQFRNIFKTAALSTRALQKNDQVVPDLDNIPNKLICPDTLPPRFETSTENISMVLKMMSNSESNNNKMFLRPSLLGSEKVNSRISDSPNPTGSSGVVTRNLTRQINQLSVRNHHQQTSAGLSWHNRIINNPYDLRIRSDRTRSQRTYQSASNGTSNFESIFSTLNELFSNGNFPSGIVHTFHGIVNQDIALKLSIWLRTNFHDNPLIREIYNQTNQSPVGDDIGKFVEFLRRCNVEMEVISGQIYVKQQQNNQILIFMTYLLQIAGYNNNYFLNISRSP
jgi:serine/threonine protein kinase